MSACGVPSEARGGVGAPPEAMRTGTGTIDSAGAVAVLAVAVLTVAVLTVAVLTTAVAASGDDGR